MQQPPSSQTLLTRRTLLTRSSLAAVSLLLPSAMRGQSAPATPPAAGPILPGGINGVAPGTPMATDGRSPYAYAGISGPGWPVDTASGHGGYRSGSGGLAYAGQHPYPFPTQLLT